MQLPIHTHSHTTHTCTHSHTMHTCAHSTYTHTHAQAFTKRKKRKQEERKRKRNGSKRRKEATPLLNSLGVTGNRTKWHSEVKCQVRLFARTPLPLPFPPIPPLSRKWQSASAGSPGSGVMATSTLETWAWNKLVNQRGFQKTRLEGYRSFQSSRTALHSSRRRRAAVKPLSLRGQSGRVRRRINEDEICASLRGCSASLGSFRAWKRDRGAAKMGLNLLLHVVRLVSFTFSIIVILLIFQISYFFNVTK